MTDYNENTSVSQSAWIKLYAGSLEVRIQLPVGSVDGMVTARDASRLLESIANLTAAGFAETLPDQKAGQHVEEVGTLVIGETAGKGMVDGKVNTAYCVVYYSTREELIYRAYGKHYLNNDEDVAQFEAITGVKPSQVANKWGWAQKKGAAPIRNDPDAAKYFCRIKSPIRVAFVQNPDYNPDESDVSKKKSQYDFNGYLGLPKPTAASGQPPTLSAGSATGVSGTTGGVSNDGAAAEALYQQIEEIAIGLYGGKAEKGASSHAHAAFNYLVAHGHIRVANDKDEAINTMRIYRTLRADKTIPDKGATDALVSAAIADFRKQQTVDF